MEIEKAKQILEITAQDDKKALKKKYRRLISRYHPDAIGSELPEHIKRAQEINAAYHILRKEFEGQPVKASGGWEGKINESAFAERNIYMPYTLEHDVDDLYQTVARGRFMWNPDEEDFDMFLRSINHASRELLEQVEAQYYERRNSAQGTDELRFPYQVRLFQCLTLQFIEPAACIRQIAEPERTDTENREIYRFRAFLGAKGALPAFHNIELLKQGDSIYPCRFQNNRIMVCNRDKHTLGYLSLEEDALYFCLIPLLKAHMAQVKMMVSKVSVNRKRRPYHAKANIDLFCRLNADVQGFRNADQNLEIASILADYERDLENGQEKAVRNNL